MIETKRLYILNAVERDIETIMTIERDNENRDFGTYDEHKTEINDSSFILFKFILKMTNRL